MKLTLSLALGAALQYAQANSQSVLQSSHKGDDLFGATSPPYYPSPWMNSEDPAWAGAYAQAKAFVSQLTIEEKVNLTTGVG